jgi:hypothetical protein
MRERPEATKKRIMPKIKALVIWVVRQDRLPKQSISFISSITDLRPGKWAPVREFPRSPAIFYNQPFFFKYSSSSLRISLQGR